jgi:hypothetical protein
MRLDPPIVPNTYHDKFGNFCHPPRRKTQEAMTAWSCFLCRAQKLEETITIALNLTLGTAKASWDPAKEHAVI